MKTQTGRSNCLLPIGNIPHWQTQKQAKCERMEKRYSKKMYPNSKQEWLYSNLIKQISNQNWLEDTMKITSYQNGNNPSGWYNNCKYRLIKFQHPHLKKQALWDSRAQIDPNKVILGDFNTPLSPIGRSSKQKNQQGNFRIK
jgi:hypothetical protein